MPEKKLTFEEKMNRLDEIVAKIDSGNVSLEENLKLYSEGTELINDLEKTLNEAKDKIKKINEK